MAATRAPSQIFSSPTIYRDLEDLPQPSPEEMEKSRRENDELNALPEVQEALKRYQEHH